MCEAEIRIRGKETSFFKRKENYFFFNEKKCFVFVLEKWDFKIRVSVCVPEEEN